MFETEEKPVLPINSQIKVPATGGGSLIKLKSKPKVVISIIGVIILGVITGYFVSGGNGMSGNNTNIQGGVVKDSEIQIGAEFGGKDGASFTDQALGVIEAGGLGGEGTHKLLREGGVSQTVYLTSSTLDLEQFIGRKVQVWGETFKAQKAGWLMDVGRLKVLE